MFRLEFIDNVDDALDLYEDAKLLPTSSTRARVQINSNIVLDGPFQDKVGILKAIDSLSRQPKVVKLLIHDADAELATILILKENSPPPSIPHMDIIQIDDLPLSESRIARGCVGSFKALCMPHYVSSLVDIPVLPEQSLYEGFLSIKTAVDFMHKLGLIRIHTVLTVDEKVN